MALPLFVAAALFALFPLGTSSHPHDHADTLFNTWLIQWNLHGLLGGENPLEPPIFQGFPDGGGRNDLLLTQSLAALPLHLAGAGPVLCHNILMTLSLILAGYAAGLITLRTGGSRIGAGFTGAAVILLPWFQSHLWHVQLFSAGLGLMALYFALNLAEDRSGGWPMSLFILLQCLASLYLWFFLNIALALFIPFLLSAGRRGSLLRFTGWWAAGNAACVPFLLGHFAHAGAWPVDTAASTDLAAFISPWDTSVLMGWMRWPGLHPEAALWPGLAVAAGFLWYLFRGKKNWMDGYLAVCVAVFALLSLGPTLVAFGRELAPGPFRLLAGLPGASSIRLPARGAIFALVPMAVMAGRAIGGNRTLALCGIALTAAGAYHPPVATMPLEPQPWQEWLGEMRFERVIYLPMSDDLDRPERETLRMMGSIGHFTPSVNGYSTTLPADYSRVAGVLNSWPAAGARAAAESLEASCLIIEGDPPAGADTVFHRGRLTVYAVVLDYP